jgi:hypothetical protein
MFLNRSASKERVGKVSNSFLKIDFIRTYEQGGDFMEDVDCFASGFLFCFGVTGCVSCGIGRHFRSAIFVISKRTTFGGGLSDRVVYYCCCMVVWYGAKDVCSLKIQAALYFGDQLVAVERLNFGNFLRSFTPITSAPLCYTSLLDAASVASRCPHIKHTQACRLDPELAGE